MTSSTQEPSRGSADPEPERPAGRAGSTDAVPLDPFGDGEIEFEVRVESTGDAGAPAILVLAGELDSLAAPHLGECLERVDSRAPGIVLDMTEVSFIDSSGLRTLIQARQMFPDDPAALVLRGPQASTTRLLELTGLGDYFSVS